MSTGFATMTLDSAMTLDTALPLELTSSREIEAAATIAAPASTVIESRPIAQASSVVTALAWLELTKPKIALMELVVVLATCWICSTTPVTSGIVLATLLGTALTAASASAWNQLLEQRLDAKMPRTMNRPLPAGILSQTQVTLFGALTLIAGLAILLQVNSATAGWAFLTWFMYVVIYTPLKTRTPLNTTVGAIAGALPVLIGWSAVGTPLALDASGVRIMALFLVLYLWQFPHFMAIAWLYRKDYAQAGMQMLSVVDPTGHRAGQLAVRTSLFLLPISYLPFLAPHHFQPHWSYFAFTLFLGLSYFVLSLRFFQNPNQITARWLLRGSLLYLPCWMASLVLAIQG